MSTRPGIVIAYTRGRTVRVWGEGSQRLSELVGAPYRYGGFTCTPEALRDVRAAAQLERIPLVERSAA